MKDPIVEEVRKHRQAHTRRFGGDLDAICEDLKEFEAKCGHQVVRLQPKRPRAQTAHD